jgi:hypothetical protein
MRLLAKARYIALRALVPFMIVTFVMMIVLIWCYVNYPKVRSAARSEELTFWSTVNKFDLEDRSALINQMERSGRIPRILPWWEYDNDLCSAAVTKYISLFTGVNLVHASAWELRSHKLCESCVSNNRKLSTLWDASDRYNEDGVISQEVKESLVNTVVHYSFSRDKIYVVGLLWEKTSYWEKIQAEGPDINSHVVLIIRGKALHFMHNNDGSDPLRYETFEELFEEGDLNPVWITEVHKKSRSAPPNYDYLEAVELRLPLTERHLDFKQNIMSYDMMKMFLVFPSKPRFLPKSIFPIFKKTDALIEKTFLYYFRNGYDMYPVFLKEEANEKV